MAGVKQKELEKLKDVIPFKWREQSVNQRGATMVAYIDARQLFDQLDKVCGAGNWQSDFKLIDGNLFGGVGILVETSEDKSQWVWKWDVGSESNVEKTKGETSDSLKRAGVQWGIGRFLYTLGVVTLKSAEYNGKYKPADDSGKIIWDRDELTKLCNQAIEEGKLDRTRIQTTAKPIDKPYLNKGTEEFAKVEAALKGKKATLSQVLTKFKLSSEVKKELESLIK